MQVEVCCLSFIKDIHICHWNLFTYFLGFEDEELEKPRFHHPAPNPKEPFSLSSPESHPSYQVSLISYRYAEILLDFIDDCIPC